MTFGKWCFDGRMTAELVIMSEGEQPITGSVFKGILDENLNRYYYHEIEQVMSGNKYVICFLEEDARE